MIIHIECIFFHKKKKQPSPKKNVRPEKNIPEKKRRVLERVRLEKKNRALTIEKKREIETENSQIETISAWLFIYLFSAGNLWRWNNGGGAMEERELDFFFFLVGFRNRFRM